MHYLQTQVNVLLWRVWAFDHPCDDDRTLAPTGVHKCSITVTSSSSTKRSVTEDKILMKDWDCQNIFRATKIDNSRLYGTRYESRSPMVLVRTSRNLPEWLTKNGTLTSFRRRSNRCTGGGPSTNEDGLALSRLLGSLTSCDGQSNRLFGWRVPRRRLKT